MFATRTLTVLFVLALAGPAPAQQKGRKVAFLVGVGEFKFGLDDLSGMPQRDVTELAKVLKAGEFEVVSLTDAMATKKQIEGRFKDVLDGGGDVTKALGKNDLLVVALCTHGVTFAGRVGDEPCIAGYDARANDPSTMVSLIGLIQSTEPFGPRSLFLVDACREFADVNRGLRGIEGTRFVVPSKTAVLFSCGRGQVAHQSKKLGDGHGLFTYALLKTLRGDGGLKEEVSWSGLVHEVEQTFRSVEFMKLIPANKPQRPFETKGELDYTALLTVRAPLSEDLRGYREASQKGAILEYLRRVAPDRIAEWRAAAEAGNASGQFLYGRCFVDGIAVQQDARKAVEWYTKAATSGYPRAMTNLGVMHAKGRGVDQDDAKAVEWYAKAAQADEPVAMTNLGMMYADGRGVTKDERKAAEWFTKAAGAGNPAGMTHLGVMLANGQGGLAKDEEKAVEWFTKAAEGGDADAMVNLGATYEEGRGVTQNVAKAVEWYTKAANAGDAQGMNNLGVMFEEGRGVEKNVAKAVEWYMRAAAAGDESAKENLKRLGKK